MNHKRNPLSTDFKLRRSLLGKTGEERVATWLIAQGYAICAQNYRKFYGEIDIIATKEDTIAFIEVKTRTSHYFELSQVVLPSKQRKIIKTARQFLTEQNIQDKAIRFDVALLEGDNFEITYIPNAFTSPESL